MTAPSWIVVYLVDGGQPVVTPFEQYPDALAFYELVGTGWSELYLCEVARYPGESEPVAYAWAPRATLGRALGMWQGGLDGPPPRWKRIVEVVRSMSALRSGTDALDRIHSTMDRLHADATWAEHAEAVGHLVGACRELLRLRSDQPRIENRDGT